MASAEGPSPASGAREWLMSAWAGMADGRYVTAVPAARERLAASAMVRCVRILRLLQEPANRASGVAWGAGTRLGHANSRARGDSGPGWGPYEGGDGDP